MVMMSSVSASLKSACVCAHSLEIDVRGLGHDEEESGESVW